MKSDPNIYNQAHWIIDRWRSWAEHQNLSEDEFVELMDDSDTIQEILLDKAIAFKAGAADQPAAVQHD